MVAKIFLHVFIEKSTKIFAGADVGGFFGNPDAELMTRWYQAAAYQPFFRSHAHLDSKRREPWLWGEPWLSIMREAIKTRYTYLPYLYSLFYQNSQVGYPIVRPLWVEFPKDTNTYKEQISFMLGNSILIRPIIKAAERTSQVYLPGDNLWVDLTDSKIHQAPVTLTASAPIEYIPTYQRGGTIVPRKMRQRRSSTQMATDPFTLMIALDKDGKAEGELYVDDGHSYDYTRGVFLRRKFTYNNGELKSEAIGKETMPLANIVERIVVFGYPSKPNKVMSGSVELGFEYEESTKKLVVRKPELEIKDNWVVTFQ
jgi:alpha 1,3-glucosidase